MGMEIDRISRSLEKTYDKGPWYGPSIKEILSGVSEANATLRTGKSHSIIELVLHMTAWRRFATRRLRGDGEYQVSDAMNFPSAANVPWAKVVKDLDESQQELIAAVRAFPEEKLGELVPSNTGKYTYYTLLHGIAQHDIYHIGQVQIILRSAG
jgi:uncharacterized damage-inducible protein DinB